MKLYELSHSDHGLQDEFRRTADRIVALVEARGYHVQGYHSSALPHFSALAEADRRHVVHCLKAYLTSLELAEANGTRARSSTTAVWAALSTLNLVPPKELFSLLPEGSVVEIYDLNNLQLWRNFEFLRCCSYTLEEIYCIAWVDRYYRHPDMTDLCLGKVRGTLTGALPEILLDGIPEHTIDEICSAQRLRLYASHDMITVLRERGGGVAGYLVASSVRVVKRQETRTPPGLRLVPVPAGEPDSPTT